jgi:hypothetical protein
MIEVLSPTAEPSAPIEEYSPRFSVQPGRTVGLCANGFTDAVAFLGDVEDSIGPHLPDIGFWHYAKPTLRHSSFPLTEAEIKTVASECDAVITAFGHCGSCTSAIIRDAANLARNGIPVVAIVTEKFADEAYFVARATGIPDLPIVALPHPVAGRDKAYQQGLAADIAATLVEALVTGRVPA